MLDVIFLSIHHANKKLLIGHGAFFTNFRAKLLKGLYLFKVFLDFLIVALKIIPLYKEILLSNTR